MDLVLFESKIKYDTWFKFILILPVLLFVILGVLFFLDTRGQEIFPDQSAEESGQAWAIMLAAGFLMLAIFWLVLPKSIAVIPEGIVLRFRAFSWKIPFETISSVQPVSGIFVFWGHSWITSFSHQIEIIRRGRLKIRICPDNRRQFLEQAQIALSDWKRTHTAWRAPGYL
ncbi:MAG: PH domain-containing protein [Candidatus Saccharicenans sp.]|nr:PH domain-containing protein [Candidatus Saccharicenans sp.]